MLDCQGSLEALVLLAERETQDNLDRMDHLEPRGLMDSPVYPGSQGWLD